MRHLMVGLLLLVLAPAACGDSTDGSDNGDEAGAGGTAGEAGNDTGGRTTGGSSTGGSSTGGRGGSSSGRGGTDAGEGGGAGDGTTGGMGGEPGGDGGSGGEPETGGSSMGGAAGVAGGGMSGAGGVTGGSAGAAGVAGGGLSGAGAGGSAGTGVCTDSPIRCALGTCPTGTSPAFYQASGGAVMITDNDLASPAVMSIPITAAGLVSRIVVQTNITHTYDGDLDISLVTPYGGRELSSNNGGTGENYANTIFADSGTTAITDGTPPYAGVFRPEEALAPLSNFPLAGTYALSVTDGAEGDTGELASFTLGVCQCLASSGQCEFGPFCLNGTDDDGDALVDCSDPNCAASCPKPESACSDSVDNDGDTLVDCADPSCAWACQALGASCTGTNQLFSYATKSVPQSIPSVDTNVFTAPIGVDASGTIVSAAVRFNATHTYDGDLDLTLASPSGVLRVLTSDNGGTGENYVNTVFIDSAAGVIGTTGYDMAPFTGSFRPEEPFSAWTSLSARGIWRGELLDDASGDGGNFTELSLALCLAP